MTKNNNDPEQPITDVSIYIAALQTTYRPASAPAEATHFFSTSEVVDAIKEIEPSAKVSPTQISKPSDKQDSTFATALEHTV